MKLLSIDEIDRELASRTQEVADLSTALMELDNHPGLEHLRRYPPTGVTAERWVAAETTLGQLWDDLAAATSILESAQSLRGRRSKLDERERAELTRLLRGSVEVAERLDRMHAACPGVRELLDTVDEINAMVAKGLAPSLKQLDAAGAAMPKEIEDLLTISATDPLSLTTDEVEHRIAAIAKSIDRKSAELAELAALQANWPEAIAATALRLDTLRDTGDQAAQTRARAEANVVAGPFPLPTDAEPELRAELESMIQPDPAALRELQRRIESALQRVRHDVELAQGLLDRRNELKGRLRAYEAKAARLGLAEDPDLLSSGRIASSLLSRRPCDLRAVTRAVTDYQQMVAEKREMTR